MLSPIHFASLQLSVDFHPHLISPLRVCSPLPAPPVLLGARAGLRVLRTRQEHCGATPEPREGVKIREKPVMAHSGSRSPASPSWVSAHPGGLWVGSPRSSSSVAAPAVPWSQRCSQAAEPSLVMEQELWIHHSCHISLCDAMQRGMTDATQR